MNKKIAGNYITKIIQEKKLASNTVKNIRTDVGSLFTWAETRGYIESNPFRKIQIPNNLKKTNDRIPWSNEHIRACLEFVEISKNEIEATLIALYTGMRIDEICNLKESDLNDNFFHIYHGKTKSSARVIPIHPLLKLLVNCLLKKSNDGYPMTNITSGGYDNKRSANFQKKLGKLRYKLDFPKGIVFHSLRNTF